MGNNGILNSWENKKFVFPAVFFLFIAVGLMIAHSSFILADPDSNSDFNKKDLSLNIYPSDTIQKEIQYTTTQINNQTEQNETITKTRYKNTDIIKVTNSNFNKRENGEVEINLDIELTEIGQILSGAPGQMDYSEASNELNNKGYIFKDGSFNSSIAQDLREELEDLSFSVLKGDEVESERNIPKGLAVNPHNTFSIKVVMKPDFSENYKYASFKLGSHSTNIDLTSGLVSYYSLQETSGDVIDSHGTNDGTNNGATRGVTGKINNAFDFDGTNDYVVTNNQIDLNSNELTFSVWVKTSVPDDRERIITLGDDGEEEVFLVIVNDGSFWIRTDGTGDGIIWDSDNSNLVNDNNWHHIVAIYDVNNEEVELYLDGNNIADSLLNDGNWDISGLNGKMYLGIKEDDIGGTQYFTGVMDEVGIWDKALNSTEISTLYSRYDTDNLGYPEVIEGAEEGVNVNTLEAENVTYDSADLKGNLTNLGDETNVNAFFQRRIQGSTEWINLSEQYLTSTGTFNYDLSNLNDNKTYEFRALVKNETNILSTGNIKTFTTDIKPYFTLEYPQDNRIYAEDPRLDTSITEVTFDTTFNNPDSYSFINATYLIYKFYYHLN